MQPTVLRYSGLGNWGSQTLIEGNRRDVLRAAGAAAFSAAFTMPSALHARERLNIPANWMTLCRIIERELGDGRMLMVKRDWRVAFARDGIGAQISGQQIAVDVDAPEKLASLAAIERSRSTEGMFPITLSAEGLIQSAGRYTESDDIEAAVKEAEAILEQRGFGRDEAARRMRYIAQLQHASGSLLDQLPPDLFFPRNQSVTTVRPVELPGGAEGAFEMTYTAKTAPGVPWLESSERKVITRVGNDERLSREIWMLTAT